MVIQIRSEEYHRLLSYLEYFVVIENPVIFLRYEGAEEAAGYEE